MTLVENIVNVLLGEEEGPPVIDPRQYPAVYKFKYEEPRQGRIFVTCSNCEREFIPMRKTYAPGTGVSHSICHRHVDDMLGRKTAVSPNAAVDWAEAQAQGQEVPDYRGTTAGTPTKAVFWPTM